MSERDKELDLLPYSTEVNVVYLRNGIQRARVRPSPEKIASLLLLETNLSGSLTDRVYEAQKALTRRDLSPQLRTDLEELIRLYWQSFAVLNGTYQKAA